MRTINYRLVLRITLIILGTVGLFMLIPGIMALVQGDLVNTKAFFLPALLVIIPGIPSLLLVRNKHPYLGPREGYLMVSLGWIMVSALGALPFLLSGSTGNFSEAYFEAMSGFTTTGASTFSDVEVLPQPILLWRSMTHWLGGVGVIALAVAILPALGISGLNLMRAETPGPDVDKVTPKLAETAKIVWLIYSFLTVLQTLLLALGGMNLFDALNHAMATMATGGFSTKNSSLLYWDKPFLNWVCTVFMILAGSNFILYFRMVRGEFRTVLENSEYKAYLGIALVSSLVLALGLLQGGTFTDFPKALEHAAFQTASIMTTTGFMSQDFGLWPPIGQAVLFLVMFVGGSTGSTAGGIKVLRIMALTKLARHEARLMLHPRGVFSLRVNKQPIHKDLVYPIAGFVLVYLAILLLSTLVVSSQGHDLLSSFTASLSTLGNIGPGLGRVGPANNFQFFSDELTWFFSFTMLLGRLELYTVLVLFMPRFWKR